MPELPEVAAATKTLQRKAKGRTIARLQLLHPAFKRRITPKKLRSIVGGVVERIERRGKYQLLHLDNDTVIVAHFRMNGDWESVAATKELPRFARAVLNFTDESRLVFVDSRALGTIEVHAASELPDLGLGPDAADRKWTAAQLFTALEKRRGPIKPALLDQKLVAGIGNIYAAESLWRSRIDPRAASNSLNAEQVRVLRAAIAYVLKRATGSRYTDDDTATLDVYDREGLPCHRCKTSIERIPQAGRSTYFCPKCQSN